MVLKPVLLWLPPTREIVEWSGTKGVERMKLADVAVPAESTEIAA